MRRQERQITDASEIRKILDKNIVGRLAMCLDDMPYVVPINFGYDETDGKFTFYFHCAKEGEKLEILKKNRNACFEIDCAHEFVEKELDCACSMLYESVIAKGKIYFIESEDEKMAMTQKVVAHCRGGADSFNIPKEALEKITTLKLEAYEVTAKHNVK